MTQSGATSVFVHEQIVDYNVNAITSDLSINQNDYISASNVIYLSLDIPQASLPEGSALIGLSKDGRPPNFHTLCNAINAVLKLDQPSGAHSVEQMATFLTPNQARQIASELIYNRTIDPPPPAPLPTADLNSDPLLPLPLLEDLYTLGSPGDATQLDQARQKFEGERTSYYAIRDADAQQLANHVFSVVMALRAERYTVKKGRRAIIDVPAKPSISHTSANSSTTISLSGSAIPPATDIQALDPPFIVPAAFFYALTTPYTITQDFDTRSQFLFSSSKETLGNLMRHAIDAGVLNRPQPNGAVKEHTTLSSSGNKSINHYQAIRRIAALKLSAGQTSDGWVEPAKNASVQAVVKAWLVYSGTDDKILNGLWAPLFDSTSYLVLILEVIVPGNESLISSILHNLVTPSRTAVSTVDDLLRVSEQSWVTFFDTRRDLLPKKYLLGSIEDRVHSFIQELSKILFVAAPTPASISYSPSDIPYLQAVSEKDVLVQFFASFSSFSFSDPFDTAKRQLVYDAALGVFGGNSRVAEFVTTAVEELLTLYKFTDFTSEL